MKKKLNLVQIISLIKTIESMIGITTSKLIANNAYIKTKTIEVKTPELYQKYELLLRQLNILKSAKDRANKRRTISLRGKSNQHNILLKSNLEKESKVLEEMFESKLKTRVEGKVNQYAFQISKKEIEEKLDKIKKQISNIKQSMTKFNTSTTIRVKVFKELNLL